MKYTLTALKIYKAMSQETVNHKSRLESCPSTEGKIRQASRNLNEASENIYQKGRSTCDHFRVAAEP